MIDRIYIPTLGRVDKQITWESLPDFLKEITVLVVQPKEKDLHGDKPILVLPDNDIGICKTRKFIYEYANSRNQRYGVFDDDLTFLKRRPKGNRPVKVEMSNDDWRELIETTDKWFDEYNYEIVVDKKYLPKRILDLFDREPITLAPWDPMGALAI